jgi:hypothetical protein
MRAQNKGESTVKTHSLSSLLGGLIALVAAVLLTSCGGGGASSNGTGGAVQVIPSTATIYAGVPTTFQILGDRPPYRLASSESTILPVPTQVGGNSFTLVPNNPGVIDTGLQDTDLPVRTVTLTVVGVNGSAGLATLKVAQNFLTGYGVSFVAQACPTTSTGTPATGNFACSGGDTAAIFSATTDATRRGDALFNVSVIYGNASLRNPANGQSGQTVQATSDHSGVVTVIVHVPDGTPTQLGVIRIQEANTGVYTDHVFTIAGNTTATALTAEPSAFTFTGVDSATCGTGSGTFEVFDGVPPYTAISSIPGQVTVTPNSSSSQPGVFTVNAVNAVSCGATTIVVSDSLGSHTEVQVTTAQGSAAPPVVPTPLVVSPNAVTVDCGQSASASIAGGASTTYSASSPSPDIGVAVLASTVTVTRTGTLPAIDATPKVTNVTITDGSTFATLKVTAPTTCSP